MAAFEEGNFNLGAAAVLYADKNILDTLRGRDSVYLRVNTFQIDSTSQSIYDLKPQKTLPFRMAEISGYLWWGTLVLIVLVVGLWGLVRYLRSRGKRLGDLFRPGYYPLVVRRYRYVRYAVGAHAQKRYVAGRVRLQAERSQRRRDGCQYLVTAVTGFSVRLPAPFRVQRGRPKRSSRA